MDLNKLPEELLIKTLSYLPLNYLFRIGRVNKHWREISKNLVAQNRQLNLRNDMFQRLSPMSLSALLQLCSTNLEIIIIPKSFDCSITDVFGQFSYPNLVVLNVLEANYRNNILRNMLHHATKLKSLMFNIGASQLPIFQHLTTVVTVNNHSLSYLINRVPNLNYLAVREVYITDASFNEFIAGCRKIQTFGCGIFDYYNGPLDAFWRLDLRSLRIYGTDPAGFILDMAVSSFHNLEVLEVVDVALTNIGIASLAALKNLTSITLGGPCRDLFVDQGILELSSLEKLENLHLRSATINPQTLINIVSGFHSLKILTVKSIGVIRAFSVRAQAAVNVVKSFDRFGANLVIKVDLGSDMWSSEEVTDVLKKKMAEGYGKIKFEEYTRMI